MRYRSTELNLIVVYHFILAAMLLLTSCVVLPISLVVFPFTIDGPGDFFGGLAVLGGLLVLTFGAGLISALIGLGLLFRRPWARTSAIVLAVLSLFAVPIGTIIGILVIYYLSSDEGESYFRTYSPARRVARPSAPPRSLITSPAMEPEPRAVEPETAHHEAMESPLDRRAEIKPIELEKPRPE